MSSGSLSFSGGPPPPPPGRTSSGGKSEIIITRGGTERLEARQDAITIRLAAAKEKKREEIFMAQWGTGLQRGGDRPEFYGVIVTITRL
jgi:hypothetical protein